MSKKKKKQGRGPKQEQEQVQAREQADEGKEEQKAEPKPEETEPETREEGQASVEEEQASVEDGQASAEGGQPPQDEPKRDWPGMGRRLAGSVCFLLIFALLFQWVSGVLRGRPNVGSNASFYEEPRQSLDVLFMGASHMVNAVSPMQLWEEYGIPSNNLGVNGQVLPVTYYALQEALRYQTPKVVVLDIYKVIQDSLIDTTGSLHATLDGMSPGLPRLQAAFDLMPAGERAEFIFDIIVYHERWKELTGEDFLPADTTEKGAQTLFTFFQPYEGWEVLPEEVTAPPAQVEIDYLEKIIALCEEKGISLLLVAIPYTTPQEDDYHRREVVNGMAAYAREKGLPYLNMMHATEEMDFDFRTDMADVYHVNWQGMEKVTAYLGKYLSQNYDLPDHRGEAAYADWEEALVEYHAYLDRQLNPPEAENDNQ